MKDAFHEPVFHSSSFWIRGLEMWFSYIWLNTLKGWKFSCFWFFNFDERILWTGIKEAGEMFLDLWRQAYSHCMWRTSPAIAPECCSLPPPSCGAPDCGKLSRNTVEYASTPRKQSRNVEVCRDSLEMWAPQAGKMAQRVKAVITKPDDLSPQDPHAGESKL